MSPHNGFIAALNSNNDTADEWPGFPNGKPYIGFNPDIGGQAPRYMPKHRGCLGAYDAMSGKQLWQRVFALDIGRAPAVYAVGGKRIVAVALGRKYSITCDPIDVNGNFNPMMVRERRIITRPD